MIRILLDQNFDHRIKRGLQNRIPALDCVSTEELGIKKFTDKQILTRAAENGRVVITHDERTFHIFAYKKIEQGEKMSGLIVVPDNIPIREAIDDLELMIECRFDQEWENSEWENSVLRLPI